MDNGEFHRKAETNRKWFNGINPYKDAGELFKSKMRISSCQMGGSAATMLRSSHKHISKRYALFNIDNAERTIIRTASAHRLEHLMAPYAMLGRPHAVRRMSCEVIPVTPI